MHPIGFEPMSRIFTARIKSPLHNLSAKGASLGGFPYLPAAQTLDDRSWVCMSPTALSLLLTTTITGGCTDALKTVVFLTIPLWEVVVSDAKILIFFGICKYSLIFFVTSMRLELITPRLEICFSIQLRYEANISLPRRTRTFTSCDTCF